MKAQELRIGNYVSVDGAVVKVNGLTRRKVGYCSTPCKERYVRVNDIEPVKLTQQMMNDLNTDKSNHYKFNHSEETDDGFYLNFCGIAQVFILKYVHQMQNLYYILFGEELVINNIINK